MKTLKEMLSHDRFAAEAGVELLEVREGYAKARMLVTDKHLNGGGVCQGGALFTLADLAFAAVANSRKQRICVCRGSGDIQSCQDTFHRGSYQR